MVCRTQKPNNYKKHVSAPPKEIEVDWRTELKGHTQNVDICAWNPKQDMLVTAGTDRKVFLWDLQKSAKPTDHPEAKELQLAHSDSASCITWSEDGKYLVIGKKT